jgi:hypothetical protein
MHFLLTSQFNRFLRDACRVARDVPGTEICGLLVDTGLHLSFVQTRNTSPRVIGAAGPIPERIVARSISVVGEAGKNTASLAATRDGWVVLSFRDLKGDQKAALMMTPSGKPALTFFDKHHARLDLGVVDGPKGEEFSVQLRDSKGKIIWQPELPNAY